MSVVGVLSNVLRSNRRACSHCGSKGLYPCPGPFGELSGILGRVRYACRDCRRHTWLSPGAGIWHPDELEAPQPDEPALELEAPRPDEPALELEAPRPPGATSLFDALDIHAVQPTPPRPDLRALDRKLARGRRTRKNQ